MAQNKTQPTNASVARYLAAITDEERRRDCEALLKLMSRVTGEPPRMWGASIVGFGTYHYRYASGREGDSCLAGFSSRKGDLSVYCLVGGPGQDSLLAKLGRHKAGKGCLYVKRLADVDLKVLETLLAEGVAEAHQRK